MSCIKTCVPVPDSAPQPSFDPPEPWRRRLRCHRHPAATRYLRLAAAVFLRRGGRPGRLVLSALKQTRGLVKNDPCPGLADLPASPIKTNADVVLTHDLDWAECWHDCDRVLAWEREAGVSSTLNLLTRGPYRLDQGRLAAWEAQGHEIGLHGLWHDPALAYRPAARIKSILRRAIRDLGRRPVLFRSPALSASSRLLAVVAELGIGADSSLPVFTVTSPGCGFPAPYAYPGLPLVEFPLALQDDSLFRDRHLDQAEALDETWQVAVVFQRLGGTMVLNTHPGIIAGREKYYRGFLEKCRERQLRCRPVGQVRPL